MNPEHFNSIRADLGTEERRREYANVHLPGLEIGNQLGGETVIFLIIGDSPQLENFIREETENYEQPGLDEGIVLSVVMQFPKEEAFAIIREECKKKEAKGIIRKWKSANSDFFCKFIVRDHEGLDYYERVSPINEALIKNRMNN